MGPPIEPAQPIHIKKAEHATNDNVERNVAACPAKDHYGGVVSLKSACPVFLNVSISHNHAPFDPRMYHIDTPVSDPLG